MNESLLSMSVTCTCSGSSSARRLDSSSPPKPAPRITTWAITAAPYRDVVNLESGAERFTADDLCALSDLVGTTWLMAADRDWSVPAGTLDWTCTATADHAVDCVYAPAFFLASRRTDAYPEAGGDLTMGDRATPALQI